MEVTGYRMRTASDDMQYERQLDGVATSHRKSIVEFVTAHSANSFRDSSAGTATCALRWQSRSMTTTNA